MKLNHFTVYDMMQNVGNAKRQHLVFLGLVFIVDQIKDLHKDHSNHF